METNANWPMPDRIVTEEDLESARLLAWDHAQRTYKIGNTIIKRGNKTRLAEAVTMKLVSERTTIPVPKVLNAYLHDESILPHGTIIMEHVEGEELEDVWDSMISEEKLSIIEQLRGYMEQLRSIEGSFIGCIDKTECEDRMLHLVIGAWGIYEDEASFHDDIIKGMRDYRDKPYNREDAYIEMVAGFLRALPQHKIVLTHTAFNPRNIIVRQGKVVAITRWDTAGYYPEYWEYVKAYYQPNWSRSWFREQVIDKILKPYPLENAVLIHAWRDADVERYR